MDNIILSLYKEAQEAEAKYNYREARSLYNKLKRIFLDSKNEKILALKCIANIAINKVTAKRSKNIELNLKIEKVDESYSLIIEDLKQEFRKAKSIIFGISTKDLFMKYKRLKSDSNESDRQDVYKMVRNHHDCINTIISLYKEIENFFYNEGLTDEAIEIYKLTQIEKIEKYRYDGLMSGVKDQAKAFYCFRKVGLQLWGLIFGFGVSAAHLISFTLLVTIFFGIFYSFGLIGFEDKFLNPSDIKILNPYSLSDFGHGIYFSITSITNIGSETHFPTGLLGRSLQSIEGIIGYVILAVLVAFLTRKIK